MNINEYRKQQKQRLWKVWASPFSGKTHCLLCKANGKVTEATDMHEPIPRRWTQSNETARVLSYAVEITTPLCRECNLKADNDDDRNALLDICREKFGPIVDALIIAIDNQIGISVTKYLETERKEHNDSE